MKNKLELVNLTKAIESSLFSVDSTHVRKKRLRKQNTGNLATIIAHLSHKFSGPDNQPMFDSNQYLTYLPTQGDPDRPKIWDVRFLFDLDEQENLFSIETYLLTEGPKKDTALIISGVEVRVKGSDMPLTRKVISNKTLKIQYAFTQRPGITRDEVVAISDKRHALILNDNIKEEIYHQPKKPIKPQVEIQVNNNGLVRTNYVLETLEAFGYLKYLIEGKNKRKFAQETRSIRKKLRIIKEGNKSGYALYDKKKLEPMVLYYINKLRKTKPSIVLEDELNFENLPSPYKKRLFDFSDYDLVTSDKIYHRLQLLHVENMFPKKEYSFLNFAIASQLKKIAGDNKIPKQSNDKIKGAYLPKDASILLLKFSEEAGLIDQELRSQIYDMFERIYAKPSNFHLHQI